MLHITINMIHCNVMGFVFLPDQQTLTGRQTNHVTNNLQQNVTTIHQ